jgi:hypothetical protein
MVAELEVIGTEEEATKWAHRRLSDKSALAQDNARHIEELFRSKLQSFAIHNGKSPTEGPDLSQFQVPESQTQKQAHKTAIDKSVLNYPEPRRVRDREHLAHVAFQPCLVCGRQPCDPHHLRFAQSKALGRKVSDEFTVPLCRGHHRELHRHGDEAAWWSNKKIDPLAVARELWTAAHRLPATALFTD